MVESYDLKAVGRELLQPHISNRSVTVGDTIGVKTARATLKPRLLKSLITISKKLSRNVSPTNRLTVV